MLPAVRLSILTAAAAAAAAATVTALAPPRAHAIDEPFLRGPHPFRSENALSLTAGYGFASDFRGIQATLDYGYEIAGSLWLDLRFDLLDAASDLEAEAPPCPTCAQVATFADVQAGLRYK